jgi:hypothetical protein
MVEKQKRYEKCILKHEILLNYIFGKIFSSQSFILEFIYESIHTKMTDTKNGNT